MRSLKTLCADFLKQHFEAHPFDEPYELEDFVSPTTALLSSLLRVGERKTKIPKDPNSPVGAELPCLLMHDLENRNHKKKSVYQRIDSCSNTFLGLYGTSGAGKTRSLYEYLSHNFGLYFVSSTTNDAGSRDLAHLLAKFEAFQIGNKAEGEYPVRTEEVYAQRSEDNYTKVKAYISILVYVRTVVFKAINSQLAGKKLPNLTPNQWLLIQLYPIEALGVDIFVLLFEECLYCHEENDQNNRQDNSIAMELRSTAETHWSIMAVDETQVLMKKLPGFFLSRTDNKKKRSAFSAVLRALHWVASLFVGYGGRKHATAVFSGTGMSISDFKEESNSVMAKRIIHDIEEDLVFKDFEFLDVKGVRDYLNLFLDLEVNDPAEAIVQHVSKWLRGRPRFSASFLEVYLVRSATENFKGTRGLEKYSSASGKLMQALDRYLTILTTDPKSKNKEHSFTPSKRTPFGAIRNVIMDHPEYKLGRVLETAIFKFAVGGRPVYLNKHTRMLIEIGVAAVVSNGKNENEAVLDEPIMIQAGINFFTLETAAEENLSYSEAGGQGIAFEKLMLPAIQKRLRSLLKKQHASETDLQDFFVSSRSAYGILAVDCKDSIKSTIEWIEAATKATFEGQVAPFCYPDDHFGPDLMFLMWNYFYTEFVTAISQAKFKLSVKQAEALRSMTPSLFYKEQRGKEKEAVSAALVRAGLVDRWEKVKPNIISNNGKGCLRLMIQYPCDAISCADPGTIEDDEYKVSKKKPGQTRRGKKRGWLATVSGNNASDLFEGDAIEIMNIIKDSAEKE